VRMAGESRSGPWKEEGEENGERTGEVEGGQEETTRRYQDVQGAWLVLGHLGRRAMYDAGLDLETILASRSFWDQETP